MERVYSISCILQLHLRVDGERWCAYVVSIHVCKPLRQLLPGNYRYGVKKGLQKPWYIDSQGNDVPANLQIELEAVLLDM